MCVGWIVNNETGTLNGEMEFHQHDKEDLAKGKTGNNERMGE